jgi:hypothetical protein
VRLFVTQNVNPGGSGGGVYNNHPIGVFYVQGKWAIFNEDQAPMPIGAAFNVMVDPGGATPTFVHQASAANAAAYATLVAEAGNQDYWQGAFLTQVWITGKPGTIGGPSGGVYNPHNVGVSLSAKTSDPSTLPQYWSIYNEDHAAMPLGATFNIGIL